MGSLGDELSLGSICGSSKTMNVVAVEKVEEHVKKLEEEKRKIESSQLELPLCLQMLNDAILYLKEGNKRCSEMDNTKPLLKDFISLDKPIIREEEWRQGDMELLKRDELMREKKFQQWKANDDHISNRRFSDTNIKNNKLEIERIEEKSSMLLIPKVETGLGLGLSSSSIQRKGVVIASCGFTSNPMPQPPPQPAFLQQQALRKQRRCWTPELHRRFVDALQHLGGPGVATPKQIREHMKEEGLTNDEVKSHLQKYRLHIRKPNSNAEKQSGVVLGFNLWNSSSQEEEETGEGGESLKRSNSQSDSPQGPLQLPAATTTTTTTGGDSSMEDTEDTEDAKSESFLMGRD